MSELWTTQKIDEVLKKLHTDIFARKFFLLFAKRISSGDDLKVIEEAVTEDDFFAEGFDRYDSDVCEQFISICEAINRAKGTFYETELTENYEDGDDFAIADTLELYVFDNEEDAKNKFDELTKRVEKESLEGRHLGVYVNVFFVNDKGEMGYLWNPNGTREAFEV